jgi:nicotinate-nucleotide pyrophosphorylase
VRSVAESGVQRISIGALTHSAVGVDLAMEMESEAEDHGGVRS